jgi:hypothetical protein
MLRVVAEGVLEEPTLGNVQVSRVLEFVAARLSSIKAAMSQLPRCLDQACLPDRESEYVLCLILERPLYSQKLNGGLGFPLLRVMSCTYYIMLSKGSVSVHLAERLMCMLSKARLTEHVWKSRFRFRH